MIHTAFGVVALDVALTAVGYTLLSPWLRAASRVRWFSFAGVAFLTGTAVFAAGLEIAAVAGFRTDLPTFASLAVLLVLCALAARRRFRPRSRQAPEQAHHLTFPTLVLATLLAALAGGLLYAGFRSTPWLDDSWAFWLPKGIVLDKLGLDSGVYPSLPNPDYPLGWSALLGVAVRLGGRVDVRAVNAVLATFAVGFLAAALRLIWGAVRPPFALGGILLVALSPEFLRQSLGGGADIPLACLLALFTIAAVSWLLTASSLSLFLVAVFAAGALAVKNEAVLELVLVTCGIAAVAFARRSFRRLALFGGACAAAVLTAVPWAAWKHAHGVKSAVSLTDALNPSYLSTRTDRISPTISALTAHLSSGHEWMGVVPVALLTSLAATCLTRRLVFLIPIGVLVVDFGALVWIYMTDTNDIDGLLFTSSYRTVDTMTILGGLTVAVTADVLTRAVAPWQRAWLAVRRAAAAVMATPPWAVIVVLLLGQWAVVGIVAAVAAHNGPIYYTGGDGSWYYTSAWVLAHGHVPQGVISYGYPFLLAPFAAIAGHSIVAGAPLVIAVNMLVLWPIALLCVYGVAKALVGRGAAYLATLAWVVFPLAAIPYFWERYHGKFVDQTLPVALGLTPTGDFPSLVFLLVAAYFTLRAIAERRLEAALVAGAAAGFAATVKPANLIFLPAPLVAFALARRPQQFAAVCVAFAPALAGLALWKYRGLGYVPAFSSPSAALALGAATPAPLASLRFGHYVRVDWTHLRDNYYYLREFTWSVRMITWVLVAGLIGLFRRSVTTAVLLGGWLATYVVVKGSASGVNVRDGSFFRYLTPAFPPFFFGLVAIVLLVPLLGRRLTAAARSQPYAAIGRRGWRVLLTVAAVALVVPMLAIAAFKPLTAPVAVDVPSIDQYVPSNAFSISAQVARDGRVLLSWPQQSERGAHADYAIFRMPLDGFTCNLRRHAAAHCLFYSSLHDLTLIPTAFSTTTSTVDRPGAGHWVYRVAATVSPSRHLGGNYFLLSGPATVEVK